MLCPSYYCLYSLFNKIKDKGRTVSAWKREGMGGQGGGWGKGGSGGRGKKWHKHCMHIWINEKKDWIINDDKYYAQQVTTDWTC
jgi:hypothetical protein